MSAPAAWRGPAARANKFGAVKTQLDGVKFDSAGESRRWAVLQLMQRAGQVEHLRRQVQVPLYFGDWLVAHLVLDFAYHRDGKPVWEDFKSKATITPLWKLKAELFRLQFGQAIEVVQ
jgi:hypothetical protein